jgi:spore coat polysaccharide biosynthesis predicted glycosyltransferase SpsG
VAIDDNCRLNYPINCLINGSVYAKILPYQPSRQIRFLGPEYILLREDFLKEKPNKLSSEIKNILITFGGDDVRHLTLPLLKRLHLNFPKIIKTVILGSGFDNKNEIIRQQNEYIKIIDNPSISTLIKKMKQADCAISAGGQTLNELAFLGIPTIAIKVADNQHNNVSYWSAKGYTINAGNYNNENLFDIVIKAIKKLSSLSERKKRQLMGLKLCDGQGSNRVARQLLQILENT